MDVVIKNLTKVYRGGVQALNGINLEFGKGTFGLLGPNGAGKTTLMRVLVTLIRPTSGEVTIGGYSIQTEQGKQAIKNQLGYLPQDLGFYPDLSAEEFIDYIAILKGMKDPAVRRRRIAELLELVNLSNDRKGKLKTFSGGMKRRVGIAQAIVNDPQILVVDEPTAGLDPEERIRFRNLIEKLGRDRTVLLSTHIVEDIAQTCRQLAIQVKGQLIFTGTTTELTQEAAGQVWQIPLPNGEPVPENLTMIGVTHTNTGVLYRVIGEPSGLLKTMVQRVEPTLEDGYVALMQKQSRSKTAQELV